MPSDSIVIVPPLPLSPAFAVVCPVLSNASGPNITSSTPVRLMLPPSLLVESTIIQPLFSTRAAWAVIEPPDAENIPTLLIALEKLSPAASTIVPFSALTTPEFRISGRLFPGSVSSSTKTLLPS